MGKSIAQLSNYFDFCREPCYTLLQQSYREPVKVRPSLVICLNQHALHKTKANARKQGAQWGKTGEISNDQSGAVPQR